MSATATGGPTTFEYRYRPAAFALLSLGVPLLGLPVVWSEAGFGRISDASWRSLVAASVVWGALVFVEYAFGRQHWKLAENRIECWHTSPVRPSDVPGGFTVAEWSGITHVGLGRPLLVPTSAGGGVEVDIAPSHGGSKSMQLHLSLLSDAALGSRVLDEVLRHAVPLSVSPDVVLLKWMLDFSQSAQATVTEPRLRRALESAGECKVVRANRIVERLRALGPVDADIEALASALSFLMRRYEDALNLARGATRQTSHQRLALLCAALASERLGDMGGALAAFRLLDATEHEEASVLVAHADSLERHAQSDGGRSSDIE